MKQSKINRRRFLNNSLTIGAFSLFNGKVVGQGYKPLSSRTKNVYREPEKELPIYGRFDVIVAGGGPAGWAANQHRCLLPQKVEGLIMELIQTCPDCGTTSIKLKKKITLLLVIVLSMILLQQKTNGQINQAGKTNTQITTTNDTATGLRKSGDPFAVLSPNIERITWFGERADISPDNKSVAFMAKSFGDAMVIDLQTRHIKCLTCGIPNAAFLRVMHLSNGDYILIGPDHFEDIRISRSRDNELWYLSKAPGSKPVKLGQKMSEGAAISKISMKISFAELHDQVSDVPEGVSRIVVTDLDLSGGTPKLINRKVVFESPDRSCTVEPNDFYDNDTKLTFTCYEPGNNSSVMGIDLITSEVTNFSKASGTYNEVEGIFPDGKYTCVESDRQCTWLGGHGSGNIDIWKLKLDGTGKDFERLTFFNDYKGGKASNPVVATNGEFMAFQMARAHEVAGVGYGILIYKFKK